MASIEKRGKSYRIRSSVGYTVDGKQVQPSMTWTPDDGMTERQIKKELQRQLVLFDEKCKNKSLANGHIKFETFVEQYFKDYGGINLRERTIDSYSGMMNRVNKAFGHLYLDKITPRQIQEFIKNLAAPGANQRTGGGLSPKSIKNYLAFISSVFSYAVRMELIQTNPCNNVSAPPTQPKKREWYTVEETQQLLDSLQNAPLKYLAFFTVAIFGGYRREEILGFEWDTDIDFTNKLIFVNRSSLYTKSKGIYTDVTKNEGSKRVSKQPDIIFDTLKLWKSEQDRMIRAMGDQWTYSGRVFTANDGTPMHPNTPYEWLKRHCKKHNLKFLGIHAFRHLNAALLINSGADVRTVAAMLGHSQASTTLNIYAYEFAEAKAKASQAVANLIMNKIQENK